MVGVKKGSSVVDRDLSPTEKKSRKRGKTIESKIVNDEYDTDSQLTVKREHFNFLFVKIMITEIAFTVF